MCRNNLFIRLHTSEIKSCCIFKRKTQFKICYGMDIFPGHVTFDDLFKQSDWLLRLPLVCFDYFRVSLLLSHKKILTFFQVLFIFSHIQNLTNFDIDSNTVVDLKRLRDILTQIMCILPVAIFQMCHNV